MALGLLLRVSWICFLLFGSSFGIPGYGYPYKPDSRNIGDDAEDDALMFDDWRASENEPTVTNYKPSAAQWPGSVASPQSQPNNPSAPEVERPVNGDSGNWGLNKPENLLISPIYQPNVPVKPQPGPVKPQSAESTNRMPAFPAIVSHFARPAAHESAPSSSFASRKPEPARNAYGVTGTSGFGSPNSGSSGSGSSTFQFPSENTGPSSTAEGHSQANYMRPPAKPQSVASTNRMPAFPAIVSHVARLTAPSSGFVSRKPEPGHSGYGGTGTSGFGSPNSGSSGSSSSTFQYPSENTGPSTTAEGHSQANYMRPPAKPQSAASNPMPAFPAVVSHVARPAAHESAPSSGFVSRKPEPGHSGYGVTGTSGFGSPNSGSSGSSSSTFQYPSENTGPSSTAEGHSQPNYMRPPAKPQSVASTNRMPAFPAIVSHVARLTAPSSGFVSRKPEPGHSGYGGTGTFGFGSPNSGSSGSGANYFPHLVYEEVFQYPSENTGPSTTAEGHSQANYMRPPAKPQSVASTNRMPAFPAVVSHVARPIARESAPSSGYDSSNTARYSLANYRRPSSPSYRNVGTGFTSQLPQKPADGTKKVAQEVSEPPNPQILPRRSYIVQSGNGYQRVRYLKTASRYTQPTRPIIMMPIRAKAVKGQPAAPKGVKNPQSTKW